ncbi:MAG: phosphatase [Bacteroidia bacterium]|nr:phosphatase [Bacteroidia bacterium]
MQAIIDLGTNTFHLLIAEIKNGILYENYQMQIPVKIGKGGINNGYITDESFERGMFALKQFAQTIEAFQIREVKAIATSAIRNAVNGEAFMEAAKERYGITIEIISGEKEAELIFKGASKSFKLPDENILVMDIGGGSVEFILAKKQELIWSYSFEIGAARLLEKFCPSDPITPEETTQIKLYLKEQLQPLTDILYEYPVRKLVGTAGSFETLVDVVLKDFQTVPVSLSKNAHSIPINLFDLFYALMMESKIEQRSKLRGLIDFRIDMIVVSTLLMHYCVEQYEIEEIIVSNYALKEGILFEGIQIR